MNNVAKPCGSMGYSHQKFCEIRTNYQTYGADSLIDRRLGARGRHPNGMSEEVETATLAHNPTKAKPTVPLQSSQC